MNTEDKSKYSVIRSELRTLQIAFDDEDFLYAVVYMIARRDDKIETEYQRGYDEGYQAAILKERG